MDIKGTVTMSIADYENLKKMKNRFENSLCVADELRRLNELISTSGYELDQRLISETIVYCERTLRGM